MSQRLFLHLAAFPRVTCMCLQQSLYLHLIQVDWSHPFVELKFKRLVCEELPKFRHAGSAVFWNGDVYVSCGDELWKYSVMSNTWDELPCPNIGRYCVAVYQSKLLLIGGTTVFSEESENESTPGEVWEFDESGESSAILFKQSSVPVPETLTMHMYYGITDLSAAGGANYLVVSHSYDEVELFYLDIFDGHCWNSVCSPSSYCKYQHLLVHDDTVFMIYGNEHYKASAKLLIERPDENKLWQRLDDYPASQLSNMIIHNHQLVAVHYDTTSKELCCFINFPEYERWIGMGKSSFSCAEIPMIVGLPDGAMLALNCNYILRMEPQGNTPCISYSLFLTSTYSGTPLIWTPLGPS